MTSVCWFAAIAKRCKYVVCLKFPDYIRTALQASTVT
jgi:hypothetical protein